MNFWEGLALVGTPTTILGIFLTFYGVVNNKTLKRETKLTREMMVEESKLTREAIRESQEAMAKEAKLTRETIAEESKLTREMIKEIAKYLGDLIVADGERTRLAMNR